MRTGDSYTYDFIVPRPGIFWYHTHIKPTNQEFKGMYGSFIVTDDDEQTLASQGVIPGKGSTHTMVLSDITVCKEEGQNDSQLFPAGADIPWAGGAPFPGNTSGPSPETLCEIPLDNDGVAIGAALAAGDVPNVQPPLGCTARAGQCRTNEGQHVLVNGRVPASRAGPPESPGALADGAEVLIVKAGDGFRFRLINTAVTRYFRLKLTDESGTQIPLVRIGGEGGLLDTARKEGGIQGASLDTKFDDGEILLAPADREDVVVVIPPGGQPGDVITMWTLDYSRTGQGFAKIPTVPVLHMRIRAGGNKKNPYAIDDTVDLLTNAAVNNPVESLKGLAITDHLIDPATLIPPLPGTDNEEIQFRNNGPGLAMNSAGDTPVIGMFDEGAADFTTIPHIDASRYARVGAVLELKIKNTTGAHHPFHMHGFSIQPVRMLDGGGVTINEFNYNEFVDNIDIQNGHTLVFRVRLDDRPLIDGVTPGGAVGRWVFHCHIFHHAGQGMISELVVLPAESDPGLFIQGILPLLLDRDR